MSSEPGSVEAGVYVTFASLGIDVPTTAVECLAVKLAQEIDKCRYAKDLAPLATRLTEVLDRVAAQPAPEKDDITEMADRY